MASAADIAASLEKALGIGNDEESTVTQFLDTGLPELNYALASRWDGGFAVGRVVEVAGPPSAGKTAIITAAGAAAQRAGGIFGFSDHERSFSTVLAPRLGVDTTPGRFIFKKPRTFEESITLCVKVANHVRDKGLIADNAPIAWAFDSLASMVPQSALFDQKGKEKEAGDRNMNDNTALARATSAHFPAFSQWCEELNICAMFMNQTRTKLGVMYGDPTTTPGGAAPAFYASQRLMLRANPIQKSKEDKTIIGSEVTGKAIKNKVARPFLGATWRFMFQEDGTGKFDRVRSTVDFINREGGFEKSGAYIVWNGTKLYPVQLAAKIEKEGAWEELLTHLPARYTPEPISIEEPAEAEAA